MFILNPNDFTDEELRSVLGHAPFFRGSPQLHRDICISLTFLSLLARAGRAFGWLPGARAAEWFGWQLTPLWHRNAGFAIVRDRASEPAWHCWGVGTPPSYRYLTNTSTWTHPSPRAPSLGFRPRDSLSRARLASPREHSRHAGMNNLVTWRAQRDGRTDGQTREAGSQPRVHTTPSTTCAHRRGFIRERDHLATRGNSYKHGKFCSHVNEPRSVENYSAGKHLADSARRNVRRPCTLF